MMNTAMVTTNLVRRSLRTAGFGLLLAFTGLISVAPAFSADAEQLDSNHSSDLRDCAPGPEGSWIYSVAGLDSTGYVFNFEGTETYAAGGGYTEADQLGFTPGTLAQPGHGVWKTTSNKKFLLTYVNLTYNADGTPAGTGKVRQTTKLSASGNSYTGSGDYFYYGPDGATVIDHGTFTITAKRIKVEAPN